MGVSLLTLCLAIGALPIGSTPAAAAPTELFFSEYVEGSSNNKALEIYNGTGAPIDLAAGGYSVQMYFNGSAAAGLTITLTGTVATGDVYVLAQSAASAVILAQADQTNGSGWFNGDDAVVLRKGTTIIDSIGQIGFDPGTEWGSGLTSTADNTLRRKSSLTAGDTNTSDPFDPATGWDGFATDTFTGLGSHALAGLDGAPTVTSTTPAAAAAAVARTSNIAVSFSEAVTIAGSWFSIGCTSSGLHLASVAGGPLSFTLDPDTDFATDESCTVTVFAAQVSDIDTNDPPDTMAADFSFSFTTVDDSVCGDPATRIHQIQGTGTQTLMIGQRRTVEGVVVGDYQLTSQFQGFHLQEEDADADSDPITSEGLFVFSTFPVSAGDLVRVTGTVSEFPSGGAPNTQLGSVTRVLTCSSGNSVTATDVDLPIASLADWERYESMLISIDQALTVTETFTLGRFGEVSLSIGGRLDTPTAVVEPGPPAQALQSLNDRSRIVLDDADNRMNVDPTRYPQGGLSASNTLRVGDSLGRLVGVLEQRFGAYRIQPVGALAFDHTNARPVAPAAVGGALRVSAMNVLNYFTTIDSGPDICGPAGGLDCRGADSALEFERQRSKIISALAGLDADIVGLMEIENNASAAVADLVAGLNAAVGAGTYAYIDTGTIGTDAIKVALIYKTNKATPFGAHAILDSTVDPRFIDTRSRPALAQTFDVATGGRFTVAVNHLKSKGSACDGDPDTGDGSGNCNVTRTQAALALVDWLAGDPTGSGDRDVLVIGDLNSYANEDPIDVLVAAGYTDLVDLFSDDGYSYVFQGQSGYLDYALASPTLVAQITGATEWHINADEPTVLDYNVEFKSTGHVTTLYAPHAYRSSDHDPVLVGLDLLDRGNVAPVGRRESRYTQQAGSTVVLRYEGTSAISEDLFASPTSRTVDCVTGASSGPRELATLVANGNDTFRWKTEKAWSGSCRELEFPLDDGTIRSMHFDFR